jgi:hypothetical protein
MLKQNITISKDLQHNKKEKEILDCILVFVAANLFPHHLHSRSRPHHLHSRSRPDCRRQRL